MSAILSRPFVLMGAPYGGTSYFGNGSAAAPSISFASDPTTGFYRRSAGRLAYASGGSESISIGAGGVLFGAHGSNYVELNSAGAINLTAAGTNQNITLTPSGTGRVNISVGADNGVAAFVNSATQLTANGSSISAAIGDSLASGRSLVLGTRRQASGYQSFIESFGGGAPLTLMQNGGNVLLGTSTDSSNGRIQLATHTTSAGGIGFGTDAVLYRSAANTLAMLNASSSGGVFMQAIGGVSSQHTVFWGMNNGVGVGAFGTATATQVQIVTNNTTALTLDTSQNATFAGDVAVATASGFRWSGRSRILSSSDGVILLRTDAVGDFYRLQFGGTTSSFPALKRSGNSIDVRLADDSAFAAITAAGFYQPTSGVSWRSGSGSPEGVLTGAVGALYTRTDGGASTTLYVKESGTGNTGWVAK